MSALVLDTHAVIWYLRRSPHLSHAAHLAIKSAIAAGGVLHVSAVSLAEIIYLEEKHRVVPFDAAVADAMLKVPRDVVPDMPDRMIAATAPHLGFPLVTADAKIRAASLPTMW